MKRFLKNGSKIFRSGPMKFWCRPSMSNMMILNRFVSYDFLSKPIVFAVEGGGGKTYHSAPPQHEISLFGGICPSMSRKKKPLFSNKKH